MTGEGDLQLCSDSIRMMLEVSRAERMKWAAFQRRKPQTGQACAVQNHTSGLKTPINTAIAGYTAFYSYIFTQSSEYRQSLTHTNYSRKQKRRKSALTHFIMSSAKFRKELDYQIPSDIKVSALHQHRRAWLTLPDLGSVGGEWVFEIFSTKI